MTEESPGLRAEIEALRDRIYELEVRLAYMDANIHKTAPRMPDKLRMGVLDGIDRIDKARAARVNELCVK